MGPLPPLRHGAVTCALSQPCCSSLATPVLPCRTAVRAAHTPPAPTALVRRAAAAAVRRMPPSTATPSSDWAMTPSFDAGDYDPELEAEAEALGGQPGGAAAATGGRAIQWYPGHIARAERRLRAALAGTDVVVEVRDARCPAASAHPALPAWVGPARRRVLVMNRVDQVSPADRAAWDAALRAAGEDPHWTDGAGGAGVGRVRAAAAAAAGPANARRARRGLAPRPARAALVGMPNVGKSALINRLLGRRVADSAPRPGVTRDLRWCRVPGGGGGGGGGGRPPAAAAGRKGPPPAALELLDAPGVLPSSLADQAAAARLAACNDIGGAAYLDSAVAAALVDTLRALSRGPPALAALADLTRVGPWPPPPPRGGGGGGAGGAGAGSGDDFVAAAAAALFQGDIERAGARILKHYRTGALGALALEEP